MLLFLLVSKSLSRETSGFFELSFFCSRQVRSTVAHRCVFFLLLNIIGMTNYKLGMRFFEINSEIITVIYSLYHRDKFSNELIHLFLLNIKKD